MLEHVESAPDGRIGFQSVRLSWTFKRNDRHSEGDRMRVDIIGAVVECAASNGYKAKRKAKPWGGVESATITGPAPFNHLWRIVAHAPAHYTNVYDITAPNGCKVQWLVGVNDVIREIEHWRNDLPETDIVRNQ